MLLVKRGRGWFFKFNSVLNLLKFILFVFNGFVENGKFKKFKYKCFVIMDFLVDEVINFLFYSYCIIWNFI